MPEAGQTIESGIKGYVKWYSVRHRFGFLSRDDGGDDVFVHQTAISKSSMEKPWYRTLGEKEPVVFDLVHGRQGPEAASVTGPEGRKVKGSPLFKFQFPAFRKMIEERRAQRKLEAESGEKKESSEEKTDEARAPKKGRKKTRKSKSETAVAKEGEAKTESNDEKSAEADENGNLEPKTDDEKRPHKRRNKKPRRAPKVSPPAAEGDEKEPTSEEAVTKKEKRHRPKGKRQPKNSESPEQKEEDEESNVRPRRVTESETENDVPAEAADKLSKEMDKLTV